ncbi:nuclear pore complex protein Nup153-like [Uloborus diversus]|uniref:nuclear pore complex protein Nup153-like n=1 Tax=Uloborus diversus TaxID=327109 RepID=UPI0024097038|nr:nuclear pore complex protein Nup153-like [Uloborus diversus]
MDRRPPRSKRQKPCSPGPYDPQNQSIFGKVASKVKGLLNPSWLFNVTQWIGASNEKPGCSTDHIDDTPEQEFVPELRGSKRLRLNLDESRPSILSTETQTWLESPPNMYISSHVPASASQSSLVENKESTVAMNGDDHSENSEGSASTSGCSSLVSSHKGRLSSLPSSNNRFGGNALGSLRGDSIGLKDMRRIASPKGDMSNRSLWSSPFNSRLQRRTPTIAQSNQPSFNLSTFSGPSKLMPGNDRKITSPFYEGKTTFGGASSTRKMPPSVVPYQVDKSARNQLRIREHHSEDSLEGMSSAAKRILLTLEKMSSPVMDAKKIPNSNKSPVDLSLYLAPPKHHRNCQFTPSIPTKGPPIVNINTLAKLTTLKNSGFKRLNSSMEIPVSLPESPATTSLDRVKFSLANIVVPSQASNPAATNLPLLTSKSFMEQEIPSSSPHQGSFRSTDFFQSCNPDGGSKGGGGGKMKNKLNQMHHSSKNNEPQMPNSPGLEIDSSKFVPLSITKLPTISFGSNKDKLDEVSCNSTNFTFSSPINVNPTSTSLSVLPNSVVSSKEKNEDTLAKAFVFSKPIDVLSSSNLPVSESCVVFNNIAKTKADSISAVSESSVVSSKERNEGPNAKSFVFSKPIDDLSNSCLPVSESCVVFNNIANVSESSTPKEVITQTTSSKVSSDWTCPECWIKNPSSKPKCMACETVRVSGNNKNSDGITEAASSKVSSDWTCSECWIKNPSSTLKCMACEAVKVNGKKTNSDGITQADSSKVSSDWTCPECWIKNPSSKLKCLACETVKVNGSNKNSDAPKSSTNFKFTSPVQSSPITFKFGSTTSATEISKTDSIPSVSTSGFIFSSPVMTGIKKTSEGFCFGISKDTIGNSAVTFGDSSLPVSNSELIKTSNSKSELIKTSSSTSELTKTSSTNPELIKTSSTISGLIKTYSTTPVQSSPITFKFGSTTATETNQKDQMPSVSSGFNFSSPVITDTKKTSEGFNFGLSKDTIGNSAVTFGGSSLPVLNSELIKTSSTKSTLPLSEEKKESKVTSESNVIPASNTVNNFSFGKTTTSSSLSATALTFSLAPTSSVSNSNKFTFGTTSNSDQTVKTSDVKTSTSFQLPPVVPSSTMNFKFGSTTSNAETKPSLSESAVSSSNFNFSSPVTTETKKPLEGFSFGVSKGSTTITPVTSSMSFKASDLKTSTSFLLPPVAQNSTMNFKFGSATCAAETKPSLSESSVSSSNFNFSSPVTNETKKPSEGFSFGVSKGSTAVTPVTSTVSFKPSGAVPSTNPSFTGFQPSQAVNPTFQFGNQSSRNSTVSQSDSAFGSASSNFTFGVKSEPTNQMPNQTPQASAPPSFGGVSMQPAPVIGSTSVPTVPVFGRSEQSSGGFNFNVPPASSAPSNQVFRFGSLFGNQTSGNSAASQPAPAFGSMPTTFNFGAKTKATNQTPNQAPQAPTPSPFGIAPIPPMVENVSVPAFGRSGQQSTGGFNFGSSAPANPVFQFGGPEKKQATTSGGFSFGTPQAEVANSFQAGFNVNTPPSFNFGATSTPAGPFQFAASNENAASSQASAPRKYKKAVRRVLRKQD